MMRGTVGETHVLEEPNVDRTRLSVAALMGVVGLAALAYPTPMWAGVALTATLALLAVALLGAIFDRGGGQAFWSGAAIVGWGYLALAFGPWLGARFGPRLVTTKLADALYPQLSHEPKQGEIVWADVGNFDPHYPRGTILNIDTESKPFPVYNFVYFEPGGGTPTRSLTKRDVKTIDREGYRETMHALACPVFALLGGLVARRFAGRSRRAAEAC
jgi:hypothetical protein